MFTPPLTTSRPTFLQRGSDRGFRERIYDMVTGLDVLLACRQRFGRLIGLTGSQFAVLIGVAYRQEKSGVTIRGLSDHVRVSQPHVTVEVGRLVAKKLLRKGKHAGDGRSVLVSLTPAGEAIIARIAPVVRAVNDALFAHVDAAALEAASRVMRNLTLNADLAFAELRRSELSANAEARSTRKRR